MPEKVRIVKNFFFRSHREKNEGEQAQKVAVIMHKPCQMVYFFVIFVYNTDMRIWAKLMTEGHIIKQYVYENPEKLTYSHFFDYLVDICHELDIPTPVLTKTHIFNFAKFNHVKFPARDFVETLGYDYLFLENLF